MRKIFFLLSMFLTSILFFAGFVPSALAQAPTVDVKSSAGDDPFYVTAGGSYPLFLTTTNNPDICIGSGANGGVWIGNTPPGGPLLLGIFTAPSVGEFITTWTCSKVGFPDVSDSVTVFGIANLTVNGSPSNDASETRIFLPPPASLTATWEIGDSPTSCFTSFLGVGKTIPPLNGSESFSSVGEGTFIFSIGCFKDSLLLGGDGVIVSITNLPELVVTDLTFAPGFVPTVGVPITLLGTVKNVGGGSTGVSFMTRLTVEGSALPDQSTGPLAAGGTEVETWTWTPTSSGNTVFKICADAPSPGVVTEAIGDKNCAISNVFEVAAGPTPTGGVPTPTPTPAFQFQGSTPMPTSIPILGFWGEAKCVVDGVATLDCIPAVIKLLIQALLLFVGIVAIFIIIMSGAKFVLSSGDPKKVEEARNGLVYALLGLILVSAAFLLVSLVSFVTGVPCLKFIGFECGTTSIIAPSPTPTPGGPTPTPTPIFIF